MRLIKGAFIMIDNEAHRSATLMLRLLEKIFLSGEGESVQQTSTNHAIRMIDGVMGRGSTAR